MSKVLSIAKPSTAVEKKTKTVVDTIEITPTRQANERDRAPAYGKIKQMFAKRLEEETGKKTYLPMPAWASHASGA